MYSHRPAFGLALLAALLSTSMRAAPELRYPASSIADSLRKGSAAVVRRDLWQYEVRDAARAGYRREYAVTILDHEAQGLAAVQLGYDAHIRIVDINARLYDGSGRLVRTLKLKDFADLSAFQDFSIFEDNRMKQADLRWASYPYTVEVTYETERDGQLTYPTWNPYPAFKVAVEHSEFHISLPEGFELRYRSRNGAPEAVVSQVAGGGTLYRWESRNLRAMPHEERMPRAMEVFPHVATAPAAFSYDGYSGDMSSWEGIAGFQRQLNSGRDLLPEATRQKVLAMVADAGSDTEKIARLYRFLQQHTRYVSVQLGIGGLQPFTAEYVDRVGYGDCKALTNYMQALLRAAGIPSCYALIRAGQEEAEIDTGFPSLQFNHVILCVPNRGDTIWLECTSQKQAMGYLGSFTHDRYVLLVTEQGYRITRTPVYGEDENLQLRHARVQLEPNGSARLQVETRFTGMQNETIAHYVDAGEEEQKKFVHNTVELPSFRLLSCRFDRDGERLSGGSQVLVLEVPGMGSLSGTRMFMKSNLMNRRKPIPRPEAERMYELRLHYAYTDIDSVTIELPEGFRPEKLPPPVLISTPFGEYESYVRVDGGLVVYLRKEIARKGSFPPGEYNAYIGYLNEVARSDQQNLVLVRD